MRRALRNVRGLVIYQTPRLRSPQLVAGFAGWPNAGEVATRSVKYLRKKLQATKFAEIECEDYYEFTVNRPQTTVEQGVVTDLEYPTNEFFFWKDRRAPHNLVLFLGTEPNLRWNDYIDAILGVAEQLGVARIYTLGGVFDSVPHTRAPRLTSLVSHSSLKQELVDHQIEFADYEGPTSIQSALLSAAAERNIEVIGLWGRAPYYIQVPNPKVCHTVLSRLSELLGVNVDLVDMHRAGLELDQQVNKALEENPQLKTYVERLEESYDSTEEGVTLDRDEILKGVEEFFRRGQ